jgi:hypothetical protein
MQKTGVLRTMDAWCLVAALCLVFAPFDGARANAKPPETAEALIYSTMPSTAAHRPEMAMDGDARSYFKSVYGMSDGDDFVILFSQPIPLESLHITTGDNDSQDTLTDGTVEIAPDAVHYSKAAAFDKDGVADTALHGKLVQALRIRVDTGKSAPALVIREIAIKSSTRISHIQWGPGRGFVDISQAPDLADWARTAERQMESFWADTAALLYSDDFITPNAVNVVYRTGPDVTAVAATGGGVMTVNSKWCRAHPEDTGLTVHETAHVIQSTPYDPVWLVEGIADYIRWIKFEPEHYQPRIDTRTATYHDSYRTTATFLAWCELHYDSRLVTKLNHDVRFGTYRKDLFKRYCGKDVDTLWAEFATAYNSNPAGIITRPVAPGDRPRPLPTVRAGSSMPADLSAAFNTQGIVADGAQFSGASGFDSGGAAYSAALLGATLAWKEVQFHVGPANAANVATCQGQIIALPTGNYASLWLLGAAVEGGQMAQTFTVTYTDGTTATLIQNLSDWFQPQSFPGESRAVKMAYRNMANGVKDGRTFYAYSYGFSLDSTRAVKSLTLPNNANIKLVAITVAN